MRWIWIDKFVEFVPGERASAVKNVTRAEDYLHDHIPGYAVMPPSLMIEGMAQTAGILVGQARGFRDNVILAKIRRATFDDYAVPGDQLRYVATMDSIDERAAVTRGVVFKNEQTIGSVDLMFSHLDRTDKGLGVPEDNFVFTGHLRGLLTTCEGWNDLSGINE